MRETWHPHREARAHFWVLRLRRWPIVVALILVAGLALLPWHQLAGVIPSLGNRHVAPGVTFLGRDLSGRTAREVRPWLEQVAAVVQQKPQDSLVRQETFQGFEQAYTVATVTPGVSGYKLDVEASLLRILTAPEGHMVQPALTPQPPAHDLSKFPKQAVTHGNTAKPQVALMVNVDWGEKEIPNVLQALDKAGVKATFFVSGRWAQRFPNVVKQIAAAGHEIGSHGYDLSLDPVQQVAKGQLRADIQKSVAAIQSITGQKVVFWAPHKGAVNQQVIDTAAELGCRTILWSLDTVDWRDPDVSIITQRVLGKAQPGDLVLMHPKPNTAQALPQILSGLKSKGLQPVTLSQVLTPDRADLPGQTSPLPTEVPTLAPLALN